MTTVLKLSEPVLVPHRSVSEAALRVIPGIYGFPGASLALSLSASPLPAIPGEP